MPASRLTLSHTKVCKFASEETTCFEAKVHFDGKPVCLASNDGKGGCNDYRPLRGETQQDMQAKIDALAAYVAGLPKLKIHGLELDQDLDLAIATALERTQGAARFRRLLTTHLVCTKPGSEGIFTSKFPLGTSQAKLVELFGRPDSAASFKARHGLRDVLNSMPFEEALDLYLSNGALPAPCVCASTIDETPNASEEETPRGPRV